MTLKIYGIARSRAFRNLWAAAELGLPYEQVQIDFSDGPNSVSAPSFKAVSPMGEIPVIDDDGFLLSQSLAINLYLAKKQGGPLYPKTLHGEAKVWQWTLWVATAVEPHVNTMATHRVYRAPADRDESIALAAQASLGLPLGVLADALAATGSLVGDGFTIADLNVATVLYSARNVGLDLGAVPDVTAWLDRCLDRPAAKVARKMRE